MVDFKSSILGSDETLFSNPDALDPDFVPKILPHREDEQKEIIFSIKPLLQSRSGGQLLIKGRSGVGKTVCVKRILMDLQDTEEADDILVAFVNCWTSNTSYKIAVSIANSIGFRFTQNLNTQEIFEKIKEIVLQHQGIVVVLDEVDKADDYDFLYNILESIPKKTLIMITNELTWGEDIDLRIRSRLLPDVIEFKPYNAIEISSILQQRIKYAFYENVWDEDAFNKIVAVSSKFSDVRVGIKLLKSAGELAERDGSKKIEKEHAEEAISKTENFKIKSSDDFTDEEKLILEVCKNCSGQRIGKLYDYYLSVGGKKSEKTLKRKLQALEKKGVIEIELSGEGFKGKSSIIKFKGLEATKLSDFEAKI